MLDRLSPPQSLTNNTTSSLPCHKEVLTHPPPCSKPTENRSPLFHFTTRISSAHFRPDPDSSARTVPLVEIRAPVACVTSSV